MTDNRYNKLSQEGQVVSFYKERSEKLAELIRELAREKATRLMAKKLDVSTQAINIIYPLKGGKS